MAPFLYGVARNLVKRHLERDRKQSYLDEGMEPASAQDPLGDLTQKENLQSLREAIAALPPKYREVKRPVRPAGAQLRIGGSGHRMRGGNSTLAPASRPSPFDIQNANEMSGMNRNEEILIAGLQALAAAETSAPPAAIEASLIKRLKSKRAVAWPLALEVFAAAAILLIAIYSQPARPANDGFIPVPYATPIGQYERADLVRVNVPVSALAQWGLPVSSFNPDQRIDAEVVIGEDGLARAVRLISNQ